MPSEETSNRVALALTLILVIGILLYGFFILQQLLLASILAIIGILMYLAWRYLR